MSNLKDNDMDGLFQRASERYPLRTDSADWDRMAEALDQEPSVLLGGEEDRGRRRRWAWLLLLLPLAGIGYWTINWAAHKKESPAAYAGNSAGASTSANNATSKDANNATPKDAGNTTSKDADSANLKDAGTPSDKANNKASGRANAAVSDVTGSTNKPASSDKNNAAGSTIDDATGRAGTKAKNLASTSSVREHRGNKRRGDRRSGKDHYADAKTNVYAKTNDAENANPAGTDAINSTSENRKGATGDNAGNPSKRSWIDPGREEFPKGYAVTAAALVIKKDSVVKKKASAAKKNSFLYVGAIGAPDYSTIHLQTSKGVGTTFGLLVGYALNQRWAIETGAYIETKKYYTKGEYFNTKALNLSGNESINNLDGTCTMWEIPINVRYNFNTEGNFRWFATAGISTYLMTNEKYTALYQSSNYGRTVTWPEQVQWKGGDNYLFSIFNFSGGFEQRIGKVGNLRIEPYWRIPLSGLGHGNLSILSTGLNIGFTRRLW